MRSFVLRYPIGAFLIINYLISWVFLYPSYQLILREDDIPPLALIGLIGAYGPSIAAIIVQWITDKKSLKGLLKRIVKVRARWQLIVLIIGFPLVIYGISYVISAIVFNGDLTLNWRQGFSSIPFWFLVALPFGPMGEELGWRGFMLPRLLEKYSIVKSTIYVGLAWGIWHLASFTFPGAAIPEFLPVSIWTILLFCLNTISLSLIYTYIHLKSGGSVFYAIILHAFFNAASNITFEFFKQTEDLSLLLGSYCFNILLVGVLGYVLIKLFSDKDNRVSPA